MTTGAMTRRVLPALIAAGVGLLVIGLAAPAAAQDDEVVAVDIRRICPAPNPVSPGDFPDIAGNTHRAAIRCAAEYDLARGYRDGTYRPSRSITRGEMATFVTRLLETARGAPLPDSDADFPDIDGSTHARAIRALAGIEVVGGYADGTYGPADPVTRGQMARFLANALDYAHNEVVDGSRPYPVDHVPFPDAQNSAFRTDIGDLYAAGIVRGDTAGNYRPSLPVNRAQMASFVMRSGGYLDQMGVWAPTAELITHRIIASWVQVVDSQGRPGRGEPGTLATVTLVHDRLERTLTVRYRPLEPPAPTDAPQLVLAEGAMTRPGDNPVTLIEGAALNALGPGQILEVQLDADDLGLDLSAIVAAPDGYLVALRSAERPDGILRGQLPDGGLETLPNRSHLPRNAGVAVNLRTGTPTLTLGVATAAAQPGDHIVGYGSFDERVFVEVADLTVRGHRLTRLYGAFHVLAHGTTLSGWHLQDFTPHGTERVGILLNDAEQVTVTGNLVDGLDAANTVGLMSVAGSTVTATVTGNDFVDGAIGIWKRQGSLITVDDNLVAGHSVVGILADGDGHIRNNDLLDNARGLQLDISYVSVRDNIFEANGEHLCIAPDTAYDLTRLRDNNFFIGGVVQDGHCLVPS